MPGRVFGLVRCTCGFLPKVFGVQVGRPQPAVSVRARDVVASSALPMDCRIGFSVGIFCGLLFPLDSLAGSWLEAGQLGVEPGPTSIV